MAGTEEKNTAQILNSPWVQIQTQNILSFYQYPTPIIKRYALYSTSLDRFLLVDGLDLWAIEHAAKLLSSKFSTIICIFSSEEPRFNNEDCLTWSLVNKNRTTPNKQTPELHIIASNSEIVQEGLPIEFLNQFGGLSQDQEFALFVLRTAYAMKLTDLFCSSHTTINNEDQNFYCDFFSNDLDKQVRPLTRDKTIWPNGFLTTIGAIIYRAQTIPQALQALTDLCKEDTFDIKLPLYEQSTASNTELPLLYKQMYLKKFFEFLGWAPE